MIIKDLKNMIHPDSIVRIKKPYLVEANVPFCNVMNNNEILEWEVSEISSARNTGLKETVDLIIWCK